MYCLNCGHIMFPMSYNTKWIIICELCGASGKSAPSIPEAESAYAIHGNTVPLAKWKVILTSNTLVHSLGRLCDVTYETEVLASDAQRAGKLALLEFKNSELATLPEWQNVKVVGASFLGGSYF